LAQILELEDDWKELVQLSHDNLFAAIRESRWTLAATNLKLYTRTTARLGIFRSSQRVLADAAALLSNIEYVDILFETQLRIQIANGAIDEGDGMTAQLELENALRNLPTDVDSETRMSVLWGMASALFSVGNHAAALEATEAARALLDGNAHLYQKGMLLTAAVSGLLNVDNVDPKLVEKVERDLATCVNLVKDQPLNFTKYTIDYAWAEFAIYKKNFELFKEIVAGFPEDFPEDREWRSYRKLRLAEIALIQGLPDDALAYANEGLELVAAVDWNYGLKDTLIRLSKVFAAVGQFEKAHDISLKVAEFKPALS
jgi:tetratricopeptide (TPR) repeat protein